MNEPTGEDNIAIQTVEEMQQEEWAHECMTYRGEVLKGHYAHYCAEWDGLPIDETCIEWPCCSFEPEGTTPEVREAAHSVNDAAKEDFEARCSNA